MTVQLEASPQTIRAERAVLGCIMREPPLLAQVSEILSPSDFHRPQYGAIFELMLYLAREGRDYGYIGLPEAVAARNDAVRFGSISEVLNLDGEVPSVLAVRAWVDMVRESSVRRQIEALLRSALAEVRAGDVEPVLREVVQVAGQLQGLADDADGGQVVREMLAEMQAECEDGAAVLRTGLEELDDLIGGGLRRKEMTVLAGRPGSGKTAVALNLARHMLGQGAVVGVVSLEMTRTALMRRMTSAITSIPMDLMMSPRELTQDDWQVAADVEDALGAQPLHFIDTSAMTADQVMAQARAWKLRGLDILIVDHFEELVHPRADRPDLAAAASLATLKDGCKALGVHLLLLQQLGRDVEKRQNKRPLASDLRSTGAMEQKAHNIIMVYRDAVYNETNPEGGPNGMELIVRKQRNGRNGTARVLWEGCYQRVRDIDFLAEVPNVSK